MNVQLLMEAVETEAMTASEKGLYLFWGVFLYATKKETKIQKEDNMNSMKSLKRAFIIMAAFIAVFTGGAISGYAAPGDITTIAGTGLSFPSGVAVDSIGNIYIADTNNHRIRKVGIDGIITTVAGNGFAGYSGDGGTATSAGLFFPRGVAVDSIGNIYIADMENQRIRKVGIDGVITTVAGGGIGGDGGPATSASLRSPFGVAVDSIGNIYIADFFNSRIRKVGIDGVITTIAGNGSFGYSGDGGQAASASLAWPFGVAVDSIGNIYIGDTFNNRIRKVGTDGVITTIAGNGLGVYSGDGGQAASASLNNPTGVAVDSIGNIYIADTNNSRIRKVGIDGVITTVAGGGSFGSLGDGGPATSASLASPFGVAVDSIGNIYIADFFNHRIRKVEGATSAIDTTPPVITITNPVAGDYPISNSIIVGFTVTDEGSGVGTVSASIDGRSVASGETVKLYELGAGSHTLTVEASDIAGNTSSKSVIFNVTVSPASLIDLIWLFYNMGLIDNQGIATSLVKQIENGTIGAFINHLDAQTGKHIDSYAAGILKSAAMAL